MVRRAALAAVSMLLVAVSTPVLAAEPAGWNPDTGIYAMVFPIDDPHSFSDTPGVRNVANMNVARRQALRNLTRPGPKIKVRRKDPQREPATRQLSIHEFGTAPTD